MRTLIKLAVGAAIAGALVNLLVRKKPLSGRKAMPVGATPATPQRFTLQELGGENAEWGGGSSGLSV